MTNESTKDLMQLAGVLFFQFFYVASLANISKGMTGAY
jgi:hypothetical protein